MAQQPITIERQPDGRHYVTDGEGQVLGKHKSVFSAARQIHDYYGGSGVNQPESSDSQVQPVEPGDVEPQREEMEAKRVGSKQAAILERPRVPAPPKSRPKQDRPKIPTP